jgi:hypothetical protein
VHLMKINPKTSWLGNACSSATAGIARFTSCVCNDLKQVTTIQYIPQLDYGRIQGCMKYYYIYVWKCKQC